MGAKHKGTFEIDLNHFRSLFVSFPYCIVVNFPMFLSEENCIYWSW